MKVCFYANVARAEVEKIEFYNNDVRILRELGHEVVIAGTVTELIRTKGVDLYYVWWWNRAVIPIMLAKLRRAKVLVCGVFDYFLPYPTRYDYVSRPRWQKFLMRFALARADANIFVCKYEFELVCRFFEVKNPKMIYLAVDANRYIQKSSQSLSKRLLNISWAGPENAKRKGLYEIVRAMPAIVAAHPDVTLIMGGRPGVALSSLKELANRLSVSHAIHFVGELSVQEKVAEMQRAALYLQPSMYEGFGSAVAEAMACGTSAACTMAGSLTELIGTTGEQILTMAPECIADVVNRYLWLKPTDWLDRGARCAVLVRDRFSYEVRRNELGRAIASVMGA